MIKFAIKTGLAAGAVYYTIEEGVWKDGDTSSVLYSKIKTNVSPFVRQATEQLPFQLPTLPKTEGPSHVCRTYWNSGVKNVFNFLLDLPAHVKNGRTSMVQYVESFIEAPSTTESSQEKQ